jgi:hypothetical protein
MHSVWHYQSFYRSCQCPSIIAKLHCQMKRLGKLPHRAGHGEKTGDGRYIPTHLSVCAWAMLIVVANIILIENCLLHSLNGIVGPMDIPESQVQR